MYVTDTHEAKKTCVGRAVVFYRLVFRSTSNRGDAARNSYGATVMSIMIMELKARQRGFQRSSGRVGGVSRRPKSAPRTCTFILRPGTYEYITSCVSIRLSSSSFSTALAFRTNQTRALPYDAVPATADY